MRTSEPKIALYIRIPLSLSERIEAGRVAASPDAPWRAPNKQDYLVGILEREVPGGAPPVNPRQLDIEDVIDGKVKARKVTRKPARTKVARRAKSRKARKGA
jgi:hypothetical protein